MDIDEVFIQRAVGVMLAALFLGEFCLKSGDSYTYERKKDEKEVFTIKNERHIDYWQKQVCDVYLVHRRSDGVIRWMNVSEYLRKRKGKQKKQIVFEGEPFTVYTLLELRDEYLRGENNIKNQNAQ